MLEKFGSIYYVPPSLPIKPGFAKPYALEGNEAVIKTDSEAAIPHDVARQ